MGVLGPAAPRRRPLWARKAAQRSAARLGPGPSPSPSPSPSPGSGPGPGLGLGPGFPVRCRRGDRFHLQGRDGASRRCVSPHSCRRSPLHRSAPPRPAPARSRGPRLAPAPVSPSPRWSTAAAAGPRPCSDGAGRLALHSEGRGGRGGRPPERAPGRPPGRASGGEAVSPPLPPPPTRRREKGPAGRAGGKGAKGFSLTRAGFKDESRPGTAGRVSTGLRHRPGGHARPGTVSPNSPDTHRYPSRRTRRWSPFFPLLLG